MLPLPGATTQLCLLPITGLAPDAERDALEIPATEIRRAGLADVKQSWIILDDHNRDTLETSFYLEPAARMGAFSRTFRAQVAARFLAAHRRRGADSGVDRTERCQDAIAGADTPALMPMAVTTSAEQLFKGGTDRRSESRQPGSALSLEL